jgi:hypothetical protein
VQTFLPHEDFARSAEALDDRRLGKQRVEVLQILRALHLDGYGWRSHPAVTMWRGHTPALVCYGFAVIEAWVARGFADTTARPIAEFVHPDRPRTQQELDAAGLMPPWLGWAPLHASHRAALVRKDPERYGTMFPGVPEDLPYTWPDPPAPEREPGRRDAWVLRGRVTPGAVAIPALPGETTAELATRRPVKRVKQLQRLAGELEVGDPVVTPLPDGSLRLGVVAGSARRHGMVHRLPVDWDGHLPVAALRFPAALQDPQAVFALHDEPALRAALPRARTSGAG